MPGLVTQTDITTTRFTRSSDPVVITNQMLTAFAQLTGDFNPIHFDESEARAVFDKVSGMPVHGMLVLSLLSPALWKMFGDRTIASSVDFQLSAPVIVGDSVSFTLRLPEVTVLGDHQLVKLRIWAFRHREEEKRPVGKGHITVIPPW